MRAGPVVRRQVDGPHETSPVTGVRRAGANRTGGHPLPTIVIMSPSSKAPSSKASATARPLRTRGVVPVVVLLAVVAAGVVVPLSRMSTDLALELLGLGVLVAGAAADALVAAGAEGPAAVLG